jgi:hypothetical protein
MKNFSKRIRFLGFTVVFVLALSNTFSQGYLFPGSAVWDSTHNRTLISSAYYYVVYQRNMAGVYSIFSDTNSKRLIVPSSPYNSRHRGMTLFNGYLYVADWYRILKFDLNTGQAVDSIVFPDKMNTELCDIETDGINTIFVSDWHKSVALKGVVHKVDATTKQIDTLTKELTNPTGLLYEASLNRLLVVFWNATSAINSINVSTGKMDTVRKTTYNGLHGIATDGKGNYYLSEWGSASGFDGLGNPCGRIFRFAGFAGVPIIMKSGLAAPTDIFYNKKNDSLSVPELFKAGDIAFVNCGVDLVPPVVDTVFATSLTTVKVVFNETMNATAINKNGGFYTGLGAISSIVFNNTEKTEVLLTIPSLTPGMAKTLSIVNVQDLAGNKMTKQQSFSVKWALSAIEDPFVNSPEVYPNPSKDHINLSYELTKSSEIEISLFDLQGRKITNLGCTTEQPGKYNHNFDISGLGLEEGLYLLKFVANDKTSMLKINVIK